MEPANRDLLLDENQGLGSTNKKSRYSITRVIQRYLIPSWIAALWYSLSCRCLVSTQARVQFSTSISFGRGTVVKPFAILQTQSGIITIGRECAIGSFNHISTGEADVRMGDYVRLGPHVTILGGSRNFKRRDALIINQGSHHKSVTIGNDVLIGAGCVILPGSVIGQGAVIGAGSVVSGDIPPYAIAAGSPAKIISERE